MIEIDAIRELSRLCKEGNVEAIANLGKDYYFGWTRKQDYETALRYLLTAGEKGDSDSQFLLGSMFSLGLGTKQDIDIALKWFLYAADQGVPEAMYDAAKILLSKNDEHSHTCAVDWMRCSAASGYDLAAEWLSEFDVDS